MTKEQGAYNHQPGMSTFLWMMQQNRTTHCGQLAFMEYLQGGETEG